MNARARCTVVALAAALVAAACSGGSSSPAAPATSAPTTLAATTAAPTTSAAPATTRVAPSTSAAPATVAIGAATTAPASGEGLTRIEVPTAAAQYVVLYVRPDLDRPRELPVAVVRGVDGTTVVTDGRLALAPEHYRVATFDVAAPGDVDGDGIDDLTELADPATMNPVNPAKAIPRVDGVVLVPDRATWDELSYQGSEVAIDTHLAQLEFVKFYLVGVDAEHPTVYLMNTETHRAHFRFAGAIGLPGGRGPQPGQMRGEIVYHPEATGPDGTPGLYRFEFEPNDAYGAAEVRWGYELLASSMPFLAPKLAYYPMPNAALPRYRKEKAAYDAYRMPVVLDADLAS